jgi:hypothetical protein
MYGEKFKRKLSEVNTRAVSRRQNEFVGKFKMAAGYKVMEYMYIPTGNKRELVRSGVQLSVLPPLVASGTCGGGEASVQQ